MTPTRPPPHRKPTAKSAGGGGCTVGEQRCLTRLLHHSHVLNIRGESFRLMEKRQAGLFPSQQHLAASPEEAGNNYAD